MRSWLESPERELDDPTETDIRPYVDAATPFWLDIENPSDEVIDQLAEALHLHPLAVDDSKEFGQRGKLQVYRPNERGGPDALARGEVAMIVGFGIDDDEPVEVHAYYTTGFLVTLRRRPSSVFDELHRTGSVRPLLGGDPLRVLHHVVTALHGPFRPVIDRMDAELDRLEASVLEEPTDDQLAAIARVKQQSTVLRRTLTPGRDLSSRSATLRDLPGLTDDDVLYAADISDELHELVADLSAVSERSLGLLGLHASITSNRQGAASRQLAVVATIFLPITFVVGFFGMNFNVLIAHFEQGWAAFFLLGIGLNVACVIVTFVLLGRRGMR